MSKHKHPHQALAALLLDTIDSAGSDGITHAELIQMARAQEFTPDAGRAALDRLGRDGCITFTASDGEIITRREVQA